MPELGMVGLKSKGLPKVLHLGPPLGSWGVNFRDVTTQQTFYDDTVLECGRFPAPAIRHYHGAPLIRGEFSRFLGSLLYPPTFIELLRLSIQPRDASVEFILCFSDSSRFRVRVVRKIFTVILRYDVAW